MAAFTEHRDAAHRYVCGCDALAAALARSPAVVQSARATLDAQCARRNVGFAAGLANLALREMRERACLGVITKAVDFADTLRQGTRKRGRCDYDDDEPAPPPPAEQLTLAVLDVVPADRGAPLLTAAWNEMAANRLMRERGWNDAKCEYKDDTTALSALCVMLADTLAARMT